ncbi:DUF664 domain-containing protein [Streptomyces sp. UNOC14_S4]|uniref:mycothiol transferase n=1 Tax=Streptomyces sp. UNOC14_S4 TaxID=2872340 RepID=UPI001E2C424C|nr:DUF664 domain-containing protein [Streptomyces sp. UNOC14_S4]MCC3769808.1 DinB family protein [Streptomyces sp. UNOC14_S4]
MSPLSPEPGRQTSDQQELLLGYLDFLRSAVTAKIEGMPEEELRNSRLPSGWTPLELLKHLVYMERRWLRWGFLAEPIPEPNGDRHADGRFRVTPDDTAADLLAALHAGGERTRAIVTAAADLTAESALGGRFPVDGREGRPSLGWILFHVLQEYARHAGHLDIARELADGVVGE